VSPERILDLTTSERRLDADLGPLICSSQVKTSGLGLEKL